MGHQRISVAELLSEESPPIRPVVAWAQEPALDWQLDPGTYTDAEAIHVDVTNVRRLLRVAGMGSMTIRHTMSEQQEATSNMVVTGFGIGADGSATATGAARRASQPRISQTSITRDPKDKAVFEDFVWPRATVTVDRAAMGQQISDLIRGKHQLSREQAWATTIDEAIRSGIGRAATGHLIPNRHGLEAFSVAVGTYWTYLTGNAIVDLGRSFADGVADSSPSTMLGLHGLFLAVSLASNKHFAGETFWRRKRLSMAPLSTQPDRLVATRLFSLTHTFVNAKR